VEFIEVVGVANVVEEKVHVHSVLVWGIYCARIIGSGITAKTIPVNY